MRADRLFARCSLALALAAAQAVAQSAYRVTDLGDPPPLDSISGQLSRAEHRTVAGKTFFYYDDGVHGTELWRSDGTAAGTVQIRDLCPGSCGTTYGRSMAPLGDSLLFAANDGVHGVELWITDGTPAGTRLVADLAPGFDSSGIYGLTNVGDQSFFLTRREVEGSALWRTDGTAKGTYLVHDAEPAGDLGPTHVSVHAGPGFLYLCNADWGGAVGLWRSDGTTAGTTFVAPILCDNDMTDKASAVTVSSSGALFFGGRGLDDFASELWRSDGTAAGTYKVKEICPGINGGNPWNFAWRDEELLFQVSNCSPGLWRTDGSESGTVKIPLGDNVHAEIGSGSWAVSDHKFYFPARGDLGAEPWVYDGISAQLLLDIAPGASSSIGYGSTTGFAGFFEPFGDEVHFLADDGAWGLEVWRSDGTAAGTVRVSDIAPGVEGFRLPHQWQVYPSTLGGRLLFVEQQSTSGHRLWRVDAAGSSMELIRVLNEQATLFRPAGADRFTSPRFPGVCFEGVDDELFFEKVLADGVTSSEAMLLASDGSLAAPDVVPVGTTSWFAGCGVHAGKLLWTRHDWFDDQRELLSITPQTHATAPLLVAPSGPQFLLTQPAFLPFGDVTAFGILGSLWYSDGTPETTDVLATIQLLEGSRIEEFQGEVAIASWDLWLTDPSEPSGARKLLEREEGTLGVYRRELADLGGALVFAAWKPALGIELWVSDGTALGTAPIADANPGPESLLRYYYGDRVNESDELRLVSGGPWAVLPGQTAAAGEELWITDGTAPGTHLLKDIYPGDYPSTPRNLTRFGDRVFFTAESELEGLELWATDGTSEGTVLVKDIAPGAASSLPDDLVVRDDVLYFSAWSPNYGREAWKSDGTAAGTIRITDIAPGPKSSSPQRFARAGNRLFFSATDHVHGYELWAISDDGSIPLFLDGFENESTSRWSAAAP